MKRKIIQIDEEKCNGCGSCTVVCAEAALELVDGKAKLIKEFYCDGMGACLDVCPVDALKIIEIEAENYDPKKTYEHVKKERGEDEAKEVHGIDQINNEENKKHTMMCGCPGSMAKDFRDMDDEEENEDAGDIKSELRQWPIQLHLLDPYAPYFENADLIISADCVPFANANFHQTFLKKKTLVMFCPKLDSDQDVYVEKLAEIFKNQKIKSLTIARMEVPCCGGVESIVREALKKSGKDIEVKSYVISIQGEIN